MFNIYLGFHSPVKQKKTETLQERVMNAGEKG